MISATMVEQRTVLLVPRIDLHVGCHNSILDNPPAGTRYEVCDSVHTFLFPDAPASPHEALHLGELVHAPASSKIVHSAFWPVLGARSWVVDMDDLVYPVTFGRTAINPDLQSALKAGVDSSLAALLACRTENMLSSFLHPSCAGILLRGHPGTCMSVAREWFGYLGVPHLVERLFEKVTVLRPAQRPEDADRMQWKWKTGGPLRILFCGRQFESKNGLLALQVMAKVRTKRPDIVFTYVGDIPHEVKDRHPELMEGVTHLTSLAHHRCLEVMAESHVLFHPSKYESIGLVFLEAAAAALAVVTARGEGMDYVDDLYSDGGALIADRDMLRKEDEAGVFEQLLLRVIEDRALAEEMAFRNYRLTTCGEYSVAAQTSTLASAYDLAASQHEEPLALSDLPHGGAHVIQIDSTDVKHDERAFRRARGITEVRLVI